MAAAGARDQHGVVASTAARRSWARWSGAIELAAERPGVCTRSIEASTRSAGPTLNTRGRWLAAVLAHGDERRPQPPQPPPRSGASCDRADPRRRDVPVRAEHGRRGIRPAPPGHRRPDERDASETGIPATTVARTVLDLAGVRRLRPQLDAGLGGGRPPRAARAHAQSTTVCERCRDAHGDRSRSGCSSPKHGHAPITALASGGPLPRPSATSDGLPEPSTNVLVLGREVDALLAECTASSSSSTASATTATERAFERRPRP